MSDEQKKAKRWVQVECVTAQGSSRCDTDREQRHMAKDVRFPFKCNSTVKQAARAEMAGRGLLREAMETIIQLQAEQPTLWAGRGLLREAMETIIQLQAEQPTLWDVVREEHPELVPFIDDHKDRLGYVYSHVSNTVEKDIK